MDLLTNYLGLKLRNPVIIGFCGLTSSVKNIKVISKPGTGAIVLKNLSLKNRSGINQRAYEQNQYN